jgi:hypothetical protein
MEDFFRHRWFALLIGLWAGVCALLIVVMRAGGFRKAIRQFIDEWNATNDDIDRLWW